MPFPSAASKANCDASTDDPKLAILTDLADLIDKFNALLTEVQPLDAELSTLALMNSTRISEIAALSAFIGGLLNDADAPTALATLGAPLNATAALTAATTVTTAHRGKLLDCTNTWTLSLTAAATLGVCAFSYRNSGSGTITIDPSGGELIDGVTTLSVGPGESGFVLCDGTSFKTVGGNGGLGYGQSWQDVTASRALGTTFYNTTGKPICVSIQTTNTGVSQATLTVAGVSIEGTSPGTATPGFVMIVSAVVPVGAAYVASGVNQTLNYWKELAL